ncbi:ABC transporter permease [Treponema sp.]|uniref:ABC transporter permease n=1 Tax=Treponema sp. TaxID=166 RepID=UPI0027D9CDC1|nr:ABC transporter permease [uncultured Treponema sp.]
MAFLISLGLFLQVAVQTGTHILLGILGGILFEKAGNTNLGTEGMMLMGASLGYYAGILTGSPQLAILYAGLAGTCGALIYAFITITLRGNQVVTGLVLATFGTGISSYLGKTLTATPLPSSITKAFVPIKIPLLSEIPVLGPMLFDQSPYIYFSVILAAVLFFYYKYTRWGLNVRAIGENPAAADASGINVALYKYIHVLAGGFVCGLAGAYLSLVFVPRWQENITAGAGWISIALVIFCSWNPLKAIAAAWAFGALKGLTFKFQSITVGTSVIALSPQLLDMIPYFATIIVLVCMGLGSKKGSRAPAALGESYFREDR